MLCGVERFYILVLVLEKLPLLFELGFKFGYSFLMCWWARFHRLHLNLNKFYFKFPCSF